MIEFNNINNEEPYNIFKNLYIKALEKNQSSIEAISVSSLDAINNEVESRYVNLKFINDVEWIFFSNYTSPKATQFKSHNQISILIYWNAIDVQIRLKARIKKTSPTFNNNYFAQRSKKKNALAISSFQSKQVRSFNIVENNYLSSLNEANLEKCPDYWGGFAFTPYYFEFWEGHESRLNKRKVYEIKNGVWINYLLQP